MNSLPSPAASAEHSPRSPPVTPTLLGKTLKRVRSASSEASSSKRAMSEDPFSQDPPSSAASPPSRSGDDDIDVYMRDQGEQDTTLHAPTYGVSSSSSSKSLPVDPRHRYEYVTRLQRQPMVQGEFWYLVARSWYRRWQKACTGEVDKEGGLLENQIGPVDNSSFFKAGKFDDASSSLIEGIDVEFVPAEAWDAFIQWYGVAPHEIRRKVITRGVNKEPSLELHPFVLPVYVIGTEDESKDSRSCQVPKLELSCQDSLQSLREKLVDSQLLSPDAVLRAWIISDLGGEWEPVITTAQLEKEGGWMLPIDRKPTLTIEDAHIEPTSTLVIETKLEDGGWRVNPASMSSSTETATLDSSAISSTSASKPGLLSSISSAAGYAKQKMFSSETSKSSSSNSLVKRHNPNLIPGNIGFINLGNTCFMNSALQCLAHTKELVEYFMTGVFNDELNPDNPLGMQGAIAEAFGTLLHRVWVPQAASYAPREFKMQLSRFASQFSGYQQQDSQELVAFLLDGLHEDLNRVLKKPFVENPDWEGGGDKELIALAKKSWEGYMARNDSAIVDLFQGQYRSTLVCPECKKVSITFDPFMYLTLPLPVHKKWEHTIMYIPWDNKEPHIRVPVEVNRNATFRDVRNLLGRWKNVNAENLLTLEVFSNRFYKYLDDSVSVADMSDSDAIVCFELPCHAQQMRDWKPDSDPRKMPLILPVHLSKEILPAPGSYSRPGSGFANPFIVVLSAEEARDRKKIYEAIIERLARWTENASDLYRWEETSLANDPVPEEGDIVDEKAMTIEEDPAEAPSSSEPLRALGPKPDIFVMRIQTGHERFGVGNGWNSNQWDDWDAREKSMQDGESPSLLCANDAIYCEWENNVRNYYFGDEPSYAQAQWTESKWEEFIHPELKASRDAASAKKKKGITLQDCLEEFTKEEELGEDDLWYCPQCKKHQQATKKFDLWNVPDYLVVHLKRFSSSRIMRDKIDAFVDFPTEGLNLEAFCGERETAKQLLAEGEDVASLGLHELDEPLLYDLYAVDEHIGGLGGGHYRAYAMNHENGKWYHFDDSHVSPSSAAESVNANAYLLFYKRRSTRPIGGKTFEKIEEARQKLAAAEAEAVSQASLPTPPEEVDDESPRFVSSLFTELDRHKSASESSLTAQLGEKTEFDSDQDSPSGDRFGRTSATYSSSSNAAEPGDDIGNLADMDSDDVSGKEDIKLEEDHELLQLPVTDSPLHDIDL